MSIKRILLVAIALLAIISCSQHKASVPALKVDGVYLYQEGNDEPLVWRGLSLGWHNLWPRFYNKEAVGVLARDWDCPVVRAAIGADDLAENSPLNGYIHDPQKALECLYAVIDACIENDIYVIVDWHSHVLHTSEAEEFFRTVATKYAGCPNVIYELFNEPVSQEFEDSRDYSEPTRESLDAYWGRLKEYALTLIPVIEQCSLCHPLILMGCPRWDQALDCVIRNPIEGYDNLMYTTHFYAATHGQWLRDRSDSTLAAGLPVFISECAACEASGDGPMDFKEWELWNEWAAEHKVSMLTWSISDKNETCSMFTPESSSEGPWEDSVIKEWGRISKEWLKKR